MLQIRFVSPRATPSPRASPSHGANKPHFIFAQEPLGLPASKGYGYFQGGPGLILGPDCRYELQAKLGYGRASSVWLARDRV